MGILRRFVLMMLVMAAITGLSGCGGDDNPGPGGSDDSDLVSLPPDTGGTHTAHLLGSTTAEFGYYAYLPGGYDGGTGEYPVVIYLHDQSDRGDGTATPAVLEKVLDHGVAALIDDDGWDPIYPMIVISPQFHGDGGLENYWGGGDPTNLRDFITYVKNTYRVNEKRIYLTGANHGANGIFEYITLIDDDIHHIAAAVTIGGKAATSGHDKAKNTALWVFAGEDDTNIAAIKTFVATYNQLNPPPPKYALLSIFPNAGSNIAPQVYTGSGMGNVDRQFNGFDEPVFDWMLQSKRTEE